MDKKVQRVSVRNLVEFILCSGDIDSRRSSAAEREAMQEGSRIHRKIQRNMGGDYLAEVPLKYEIENENYVLVVEGRADGIFHQNGQAAIDEIKGVYRDLSAMNEPVSVHLAQAKCYAFIYASREGLENIGVQMTYCNLDTEEIQRFFYDFRLKNLKEWFHELICMYRKWADFQYDWKLQRESSIKKLEFPFEYRKGQKKLASDVYRTLLRRKILFLQAPTGVGKTISTVFPAVKAVGEGLGDRIFYLTAKTITRKVAEDTFQILSDRGCRQKVLTLTAKEKLCVCPEPDCNPVSCPRAAGHFDRVNDAVFDLLNREDFFRRESVLKQAERFCVCPFEMSLDLALWADVVICDYNYVFDPNICLKRFFSEGARGDYFFLVDEAHNLVERGREMYSARLVKEDILIQKKLAKPYSRKLVSILEKCNRQMLEWKRECENWCIYDSTGAFIFTLMQLAAEYDSFFQDRPEFPERKEMSEFYFNLRHFLNMYERLDDNYVIYTSFLPDGQFCIRLYCVNPAQNLQECLDRGQSTVFFSATLLPVRYYRTLLSTRDDNYAVYAESTFSQKQRLLLVGRDVSSLYRRRNMQEFQRIAEYIHRVCQAKTGNYFIFFPSYRMMEQVYEIFETEYGQDTDCIIQQPNMTEEHREAFISEFEQERTKPLAAFGVLGGIFSEGIDLREEKLIGTVIVGTGLPQICTEREILKEYYQQHGSQGFAYAYQYPGMNKVLQAAGRVIRTVQDRGVIVLLDDRFLRRDYLDLFPREWNDYKVCTSDSISEILDEFWEDQQHHSREGSRSRNASVEAEAGRDGFEDATI